MDHFFNGQDLLDIHLSTNELITQYPRGLCNDSTIDWLTGVSQITPDNAYTSWAPHENALGLSGMYRSESAWSDQLTCPSATSIPGDWQDDAHFDTTSFMHQHPPSMQFFQPHVPHYAPARVEAMLTRVEEIAVPHFQEGHPVRKPVARSTSKHISPSRPQIQSMAVRSRHTPYVLGSTRQGALSASLYQCQWSDCAGPCNAVVAGTKNAIGQHLKASHAICLKANKTLQVCLWGQCQKLMRRESIPRHVLAVHMRDKVHCPRCGSQLSRTDSLQRHQRSCLGKEEDAPDACKVGERTRSP